ncbi:hypothetical protein Tco_0798203 [Tanacetum coccineum]
MLIVVTRRADVDNFKRCCTFHILCDWSIGYLEAFFCIVLQSTTVQAKPTEFEVGKLARKFKGGAVINNSHGIFEATKRQCTASGNFGVNTGGGTSLTNQVSSTPGTDEVVCSFFAQQKTNPPLDNKDATNDQDDMLNWILIDQECKSGRNQGKRSYGDNGRRNATTNEPSSQALVAQDAHQVLLTMRYKTVLNNVLNLLKLLQKNYDSEREKHSRAILEMQGYELALESLESRILGHEKNELAWGNPEIFLQDHAVVDSGCSSHMTGNKAYFSDYVDYNGGFVAFRSYPKEGKITGKGKIRTANLDFDDVYFVDELNLSFLMKNQLYIRAPRQNGVYSLDLKNIVPSGEYVVEKRTTYVAKEDCNNQKMILRGFDCLQKLPSVSTSNSPLVSPANTPYASAAGTPTGPNLEEDSNIFQSDAYFVEPNDMKMWVQRLISTIWITPLIDESWVKSIHRGIALVQITKGLDTVDFHLGNKANCHKVGLQELEGIEAIRMFLAIASFMDVPDDQIDLKSPSVVWMTHFAKQRSLCVKQQPDGIFISQDKYVADILKKFMILFQQNSLLTPIVSNKPLVKDEDDVDVMCLIYKV